MVSAAIDSALAQDFADTEVVVVDDGSTDDTSKILEKYETRIRRIWQANRGAAAARNLGVSAASGKYLAFLDADDTWTSDKLRKCCGALDENPEAVLAFSAFQRLDPSGCKSEPYLFAGAPSMRDMLARRSDILPSTVVMRRDVFERCGGFCERFFPNCFEDPYLWILAREHGEFIYIPECLVTYRMRDRNIGRDYFRNGRIFIELVRKRYGREAHGLLADTRNHLARLALFQTANQARKGSVGHAVKWLLEAARFPTSIVFAPDLVARLVAMRNLRYLFRVPAVRRGVE